MACRGFTDQAPTTDQRSIPGSVTSEAAVATLGSITEANVETTGLACVTSLCGA